MSSERLEIARFKCRGCSDCVETCHVDFLSFNAGDDSLPVYCPYTSKAVEWDRLAIVKEKAE
jgi:ferredoxin